MQDIDFKSQTVEWRKIPEDQIKKMNLQQDSIGENNYVFFMNIRDYKTHKKLSLSPETTIKEAIKRLINFDNEIFMDLTISDLHCYLSDKKGRQMKNFPPLDLEQKLGEVSYRRFLIAQKGEDVEILKFPIEEENKKITCYCYKQFQIVIFMILLQFNNLFLFNFQNNFKYLMNFENYYVQNHKSQRQQVIENILNIENIEIQNYDPLIIEKFSVLLKIEEENDQTNEQEIQINLRILQDNQQLIKLHLYTEQNLYFNYIHLFVKKSRLRNF